jgi:hypothetical protein
MIRRGWVTFQGAYPVFTEKGAILAKQYGVVRSSLAITLPEEIAALPPTIVPEAITRMNLTAGQKAALVVAATGHSAKWETVRDETQKHLINGTICGGHKLVEVRAKVPHITPLGLVALVLAEVDPTTIAKTRQPLPADVVGAAASA